MPVVVETATMVVVVVEVTFPLVEKVELVGDANRPHHDQLVEKVE